MSKRSSNYHHKRTKNAHLLENLEYLGDNHIKTSIELIQYNDKEFKSKILSDKENIKKDMDDNYANWFKVIGISDVELINKICTSFGVQRFDIKDLMSAQNVSKVITYEKCTFMLLSATSINENKEVELEQIAFILTENTIISFQEKESAIFNDAVNAIKSSTIQIKEKDVDYLLYILLNCVYSLYTDCILKITNKINETEDQLAQEGSLDFDVMSFIQRRKKNYSLLKRTVSPMREEYPNLLHNSNKLISPENSMYFNDFDDKLRIASEDLETLNESISSLRDLYFNNNNMRMNLVIKKLTIVSTIFIPLTFIVGVWGMNFQKMPELKWKFGYLFAWAVMILIALIAIFFLKKKKWF